MRLAADRSLTSVAYHRCWNVNGTMVYMAHLPDNGCCQCSNCCCCHVHYTFVGSHRREISTISEYSADCNGSYWLHLTMPNCYCDIDLLNPTRTKKIQIFSFKSSKFKISTSECVSTYLSSGCKLMYARY